MKKETVSATTSRDNSSGVTAVVLGILSIVFSSAIGIILALIAIGFAVNQNKKSPNRWSRAAMILAIIGIILGIISVIVAIWLQKNPAILAQLSQYGAQ